MTSWRKSSFSGDTNCVEVAWRKSSFSGDSDCVEVAWQKSSFSGDHECVEVAVSPDLIGVRDSKNAEGEQLKVPAEAWNIFLSAL